MHDLSKTDICDLIPFHAAAECYPTHTPDSFERLKDDIKKNGLIDKITLWTDEDQNTWLIDGRHRAQAMLEISPARTAEQLESATLSQEENETFRFFTGNASEALTYTVSTNNRRDMTPAQRSIAGVAILKELEALKKNGVAIVNENGEETAGRLRDIAAERVGVSGRSVANAKKVMETAPQELVDAMKAGEVNLKDAERAVKLLPAQEVARIAKEEPENLKEAVKEAKKAKAAQEAGAFGDWRTPEWIINQARLFMPPIQLDVASNELANEKIRAERFISKDSLKEEWKAQTLLLSPPVTKATKVEPWVKKLIANYNKGSFKSALAILPAEAWTPWFYQISRIASCVVPGCTFTGIQPNLPHIAIFYIGPDHDAFRKAMGESLLFIPAALAHKSKAERIENADNAAQLDIEEEEAASTTDPSEESATDAIKARVAQAFLSVLAGGEPVDTIGLNAAVIERFPHLEEHKHGHFAPVRRDLKRTDHIDQVRYKGSNRKFWKITEQGLSALEPAIPTAPY